MYVTIIPSAIPKLKDLLRELRSIVSDWENIGIQLDIDDEDLRYIKYDYIWDSMSCFREMCRIWLKRVYPPPSWSAVVRALEFLGHDNLASNLRCKYCSGKLFCSGQIL